MKDSNVCNEIPITGRKDLQAESDRIGTLAQPSFLEDRPGAEEHATHSEQGGLTSTRAFQHAGHQVIIETTYSITIDGRPYQGIASVDGDGRIRCHAMPYESYPSAIDFVRQLIDQYPHSFESHETEEAQS